MPGKDAITIEGRIVEVLPNMLFGVELSNGHRLLAHLPRKQRLVFRRFAVDDYVTVELSPYDLSRGSITAGRENCDCSGRAGRLRRAQSSRGRPTS